MDKQIERQIILGKILRYGVWSAMFIVGFGAVLYLIQHGTDSINYSSFQPDLVQMESLTNMISGILSAQGKSIIQFGLIVLIFTPISRLLLAVYSFLLEGDYLYVVIGLIIMFIISGSLFLGMAH